MAGVLPRPIRVYADTSVYGGVFDDEFAKASKEFFDQVREGRFALVLSTLVDDELQRAPEEVRRLLDDLRSLAVATELSEETLTLREAYIAAGILGARWGADAMHVAAATASGCTLLVSWNFKHLVHFQKIPMYNGVNLSLGYGPIRIHTPQEVLGHEEGL
jgi:predicted nucleic acid-binding protein